MSIVKIERANFRGSRCLVRHVAGIGLKNQFDGFIWS